MAATLLNVHKSALIVLGILHIFVTLLRKNPFENLIQSFFSGSSKKRPGKFLNSKNKGILRSGSDWNYCYIIS